MSYMLHTTKTQNGKTYRIRSIYDDINNCIVVDVFNDSNKLIDSCNANLNGVQTTPIKPELTAMVAEAIQSTIEGKCKPEDKDVLWRSETMVSLKRSIPYFIKIAKGGNPFKEMDIAIPI